LIRFCILLILASLTACAKPTDIVSIGADTYMVVRSASIYFPNPESPKAEAVRAASNHCKKQQKSLEVLDIEETEPPYTAEHDHRITVQFACHPY